MEFKVGDKVVNVVVNTTGVVSKIDPAAMTVTFEDLRTGLYTLDGRFFPTGLLPVIYHQGSSINVIVKYKEDSEYNEEKWINLYPANLKINSYLHNTEEDAKSCAGDASVGQTKITYKNKHKVDKTETFYYDV